MSTSTVTIYVAWWVASCVLDNCCVEVLSHGFVHFLIVCELSSVLRAIFENSLVIVRLHQRLSRPLRGFLAVFVMLKRARYESSQLYILTLLWVLQRNKLSSLRWFGALVMECCVDDNYFIDTFHPEFVGREWRQINYHAQYLILGCRPLA